MSTPARRDAGYVLRRLGPFLLLMIVVLVTAKAVWAAPPALNNARAQAEALREQIEELNYQVEAAVEEYNIANTQLEETKAAVADNESKLAETEADLEQSRERLSVRVVEIYKAGHLGALDALLGSASFSDLIDRLQLMERLSAQDRELVDQVQAHREQVAARKAELAKQLEAEKQYAADAAAAQRQIEDRLAKKKKALAGKEAQIAQLEKEEAERQAALAAAAEKAAEEAARKARLEAAKKTTTTTTRGRTTTTSEQTSKPGTGSGGTTGTTKRTTPTTTRAPSGGVTGEDIVAYGLKFLGVPYVWGGESTKGFDCSGFTKYVYAKFGINLPHSSRIQYTYGVKVSRADLQPGDLLFFYSPISHVGIYMGNGKMVNSRTGGVRIDNAFWSSYVGAVRVLK